MAEALNPVPREQWGRDHESMMRFIETVVVEDGGALRATDHARLRCNPNVHPGFATGQQEGFWRGAEERGEEPGLRYGTRLKGHTSATPNVQANHDDWSCLEDFEREGLVENVGTGARPVWKLTEEGWAYAHGLRRERAERMLAQRMQAGQTKAA